MVPLVASPLSCLLCAALSGALEPGSDDQWLIFTGGRLWGCEHRRQAYF
jgi:hypothetical protein